MFYKKKNIPIAFIFYFFSVNLTLPIQSQTTDLDSKKIVLLTGAAGFIGSNFLEYMFNKHTNYHFLVLDALTYAGSLDNIPKYILKSPRFEFLYALLLITN